MSQRPQPHYLLLGKLMRPHGVRGEVRMSILTDYPERLRDLETVYLSRDEDDDNPTPYTIDTVRFHQGYALLKFVGTPDRNAAELLRDLFVMIDLANAVPLEDDEVYLYEIIGLQVQTEAGDLIGTIRDVMETGANDVYVLRASDGRDVLVPAHEETLVEIDIERGVVVMRLPDGLLPDA